MVRIGGGWNTLDNYLARYDPCRSQKNVASSSASPNNSSVQSAAFNQGRTSGRQQRTLDSGPVDTRCTDLPSPLLTYASGHQHMTSKTLPVDSTDCSPLITENIASEAMMKPDGVVRRDSSANIGHLSCVAGNRSMICQSAMYKTSTPRPPDRQWPILPSVSSSPSLVSPTSVSASRSCRPSRIPVPLRIASSQFHSQSTSSILVDRHTRCDSGVDLNLSSPDFD